MTLKSALMSRSLGVDFGVISHEFRALSRYNWLINLGIVRVVMTKWSSLHTRAVFRCPYLHKGVSSFELQPLEV